ncbi:HigA family addiction module antitoxin [Beijerinckia sp. L45]|uniref:HigA family addiction module antitoxin n=1 Tax=Beijerinckia sp. L45 TaxID=1641855 RepID=UPI00131BA808|nr:HigA family addiction module antitoxin [Beijerinckia sp. L45]
MPRLKTHPGEILQEEFLLPLKVSARALAGDLGVPPNRITEIIRGERAVSADTAIRLGLHFNTTSQFWLNLQIAYDLSKAERDGDYAGVKTRKIETAA